MKCKRLNEVLELLQPYWSKDPDLSFGATAWSDVELERKNNAEKLCLCDSTSFPT